MNSILQIKTFIFSFVFGLLFFIFTKLNYYLIKNLHPFWKLIFSIIFTIDCVLLYIYFNYKINNGCFHFYFLLFLIIGYVVMLKYYSKLYIMCKKYVKKVKKIQKK